MEIGQKIKQARIAKGLTQEELGNMVGLQKSAIAKYESGRVVNIKRSTLQKLAQALALKGSDLIIESDPVVLQELSDVWGNHLKFSQMYEEGAYKDLAEYFCKIETKEEQTKGKSKYHRSRNLKEPQAKSQIIAGPLKDELYIPKGYELVPESASSGFNDFAGIRYQKYMIKKAAALDSEKTLNKREDIPKKRSFWEKLKNKFRKEKRHE